jgi:hypothetical protein
MIQWYILAATTALILGDYYANMVESAHKTTEVWLDWCSSYNAHCIG